MSSTLSWHIKIVMGSYLTFYTSSASDQNVFQFFGRSSILKGNIVEMVLKASSIIFSEKVSISLPPKGGLSLVYSKLSCSTCLTFSLLGELASFVNLQRARSLPLLLAPFHLHILVLFDSWAEEEVQSRARVG